MQNIFVLRDPMAPFDPCAWIAQPASGSIYSNDQNIQWKLIVDPGSNANWDPGAIPPIVFGNDWNGTIPERVDDPAGGPPFYRATGPGQTPIAPITYSYTIYLRVPLCAKELVVISATITNQPKM